jgi:hypothetical protein
MILQNYDLLIIILTVEVSDTTGDDKRTKSR